MALFFFLQNFIKLRNTLYIIRRAISSELDEDERYKHYPEASWEQVTEPDPAEARTHDILYDIRC